MKKAKLYPPNAIEVSLESSSKEDMRHCLGYIYQKDLEGFIVSFLSSCAELDVQAHSFIKRIGMSNSPRIELQNNSELFADVNQKSKKTLDQIGLFFEEPIVPIDGEHKKTIRDNTRYHVWIYYTVKHKALTHFRIFLLQHILEYIEETEKNL